MSSPVREPTVLKWPRGQVIYVDPNDERAHQLISVGGPLNPNSVAMWCVAVASQPWDLVIDVGANYGELIVALEEMPAKMLAYEPNPAVSDLLLRTLADNSLEVEVRNQAVGDRPAESVSFGIDTVWSGRSGLNSGTAGDHPVETITVPQTTLDEIAEEFTDASICVKVDVEGAEDAVIAGAAGLMASDRDWLIMMEILHADEHWLAALSRTYTMLLFDPDRQGYVELPPLSDDTFSKLLHAGWFYPQDAVLAPARVAKNLREKR